MISQQLVIGLLVTFVVYDALIRWQLCRRVKHLEDIILKREPNEPS